MLLEFRVGNYKSFRDVQTFSMVAASIQSVDASLDQSNIIKVGDELRLLRSAALYGANASGKSNLSAALRFVRSFVRDSSKDSQAEEPIAVEPFRLSEATENEPSLFDIVFLCDGERYRYGFSVNAERVVGEWLLLTPVEAASDEVQLFVRDYDTIEVFDAFEEGRGLESRTRANALFLSVCAQFNGATAQRVLKWFSHLTLISGLQDQASRSQTVQMLDDEEKKELTVNFLKLLDLSIADVEIESRDNESLVGLSEERLRRVLPPRVKTLHRKYNAQDELVALEAFDLDVHESQGTRRLFALIGPFMRALWEGQVLFVDEMDARLHPLITRTLASLFHNDQINLRNAQLIFITHDTNLLSNSLLRHDQIWFAEKDQRGATHLYSLVEYEGSIPSDEKSGLPSGLERDYIRGRYGAIPFLGNFNDLLSNR